MPYDCQFTGMQLKYFAAGTGGELAGKSRLGLPGGAGSGCTSWGHPMAQFRASAKEPEVHMRIGPR